MTKWSSIEIKMYQRQNRRGKSYLIFLNSLMSVERFIFVDMMKNSIVEALFNILLLGYYLYRFTREL